MPKQQYHYLSPAGRRLFELAVGPATLAFIGAGSKSDILEARRLIGTQGPSWPIEWLRARGLIEWASELAKSYKSAEQPLLELIARNGHLNGARADRPNGASASVP